MTRRTAAGRPRAGAIALALALPLLFTGCATANDDGSTLRASVVRVAEQSAASDLTGALAELLLLEREVDERVAAGELPAAQEAEIRAAIELVRADLQAAIERAVSPSPTPTESSDDDDDDNSGPGNSGDNRNDDKKKKDKGEDD
ncbi:hypothetical protein ACFVTX_11240 [Agromyces sp. NPDC058136]|uniref:hypothetical protein n=1 Tax=Agromyces sp. NPDC058136 TaxID=3346354 RepID=UPI0036D75F10